VTGASELGIDKYLYLFGVGHVFVILPFKKGSFQPRCLCVRFFDVETPSVSSNSTAQGN
jgi:hypothetical protein